MTGGLYVDDDGVEITTHSMLKSFARCPKQTQYKYVERLKRRYVNTRDLPLKRGTWVHALLQTHYEGGDWKETHRQLSERFGELFDEERDALGDLPRECARIMRSYLWHYGANRDDRMHGWDVEAVEFVVECPWPDGVGLYRGRVDVLVRDAYGLWIVDHKTHKTLPDLAFRLLDFQSVLYIWAAREMGYPVDGFIWNYIRTKAPTEPKLVDVNRHPRLSTAAIDTDWPTYYTTVKHLGRLDDPVAITKLKYLKSQRWEHGKVQSSPFFRRDVLEKDDAMIERVVHSAMRTRDAMRSYDWGATTSRGDNFIRETVERHVDRSCDWCQYQDLCATELFGGNARNIRRQQYRVGDPLDYYQDDKPHDGPSG